MAISQRRAIAPRWRESIHAYRAEQTWNIAPEAHNLLVRLEKSTDAAKAFKRVMDAAVAFERVLKKGPPYPRRVIVSPPRCYYTVRQKATEIVRLCIEADAVARAFRLEIARAEAILVRVERLHDSMANLRAELQCVAEQIDRPPEVATLSVFDPPFDCEEALALIVHWIEWSRDAAEAAIAQLGATRKRRRPDAANDAAIWWLGTKVRTIVGWPRWQEVAKLANVILETDQLAGENVRRIIRKGSDLVRRNAILAQRSPKPASHSDSGAFAG